MASSPIDLARRRATPADGAQKLATQENPGIVLDQEPLVN